MAASTLQTTPTSTRNAVQRAALARHLAAVHQHQQQRVERIARGDCDDSLLEQFVRLAAYAGHLVRLLGRP
jgi:hypothetical protein